MTDKNAPDTWPKLDAPAKVGAVRFQKGVSARLVVECAQRLHADEVTPEKEAERIAKVNSFCEALHSSARIAELERERDEHKAKAAYFEQKLNEFALGMIAK